uniref:Ovule protein n=1 Tax=Anisakis simplex TaxID=6269 RepID=A0A0M3JDM6_ANISI
LDGRSANLQYLSSTSIASIKDGCTDEKPRSCTLKRTIREIETGTLNKAKLSKWPSTSDCQQKSRDNQADKGNLKENKKRHLSKSSIVLSSPS